jgi:hypothetical protein
VTQENNSSHTQRIIRIVNLISACSEIQSTINQIVSQFDSPTQLIAQNRQFTSLHLLIQHKVRHLSLSLKQKNAIPSRLPLPSYRAFVWLRFLALEDNLLAHMRVLMNFSNLSRQISIKRNKKRHFKDRPVQILLGYIPYIYRMQIKGKIIEVVINECFITAPESIKRDVLLSALENDVQARKRIRQYHSSPSYQRIERLIRGDDHGPATSPEGKYYDLRNVFMRVNKQYFAGLLATPQLTWSQKRSFRKLGSYAPDIDSVTISRAFDAPAIPEIAIDFIMYHELIHKKLGVKRAQSHKHNHNKKFKTLEKQFIHFEQANKFIESFIRANR